MGGAESAQSMLQRAAAAALHGILVKPLCAAARNKDSRSPVTGTAVDPICSSGMGEDKRKMTKPAFFITGTDTNVGKTEAACVLAKSLTEAGLKVGVMKPVETGCLVKDGRIIPLDALRLKAASNTEADLDLVNPYRFTAPVAPDLAARLFGTAIDLHRIRDIFIGLRAAHDVMLVEGAGGLLAPCAEGKSMADLALLLGLPLIIVSANRLGTINHTLLTINCARQMGLAVKGIVLNNPALSENDPSAGHNRSDIERLSGVPVMFEIPYWPDPASAPKLLKKDEVEKLLDV